MANFINLQFKLSQSQLKRAMLPAIAEEIDSLMRNVTFGFGGTSISEKVADIIKDSLTEHPTYESLIEFSGDSLKSEFGIEDSYSKVNTIVQVWANSVRIGLESVRAAGNRIIGGMSLTAIDSSYQDVFSREEAHHIAERAQSRGEEPYDIEWLKWLLTEGTNPLVYYYYVDTNLKESDNSRTGLSVMRHNMSEVWRVPDYYAGTTRDNWVTQSMLKAAAEIQSMIILEISLRTKQNIVLKGTKNVRG